MQNIEPNSLETVYFGGGTPVLLGIENLKLIITRLKLFTNSNTEFTIELNPDNLVYMEDLLEIGFNRISVGIQTFNQKQAYAIEREFDLDFILKKLEYLKKYQRNLETSSSLSLDFMFGLPGETIKDIKNNIKFIKKINPEHISYYMFTVHKNYPWTLKQPGEEDIKDMFYYIKKNLEILGYQHYEISNYAKKGFISKHNWNYWQGTSYLGLGAGAHSFDGSKRWWNTKNLYKYNDTNFVENSELLTSYQHKIEKIILGLRCLEIGINEDFIKNNLSPETEKMLISYMSRNKERFYRINPKFLHLIDWIEESLI